MEVEVVGIEILRRQYSISYKVGSCENIGGMVWRSIRCQGSESNTGLDKVVSFSRILFVHVQQSFQLCTSTIISVEIIS